MFTSSQQRSLSGNTALMPHAMDRHADGGWHILRGDVIEDCRRVAILSVDHMAREQACRVVRRLGHEPAGFSSVAEMREAHVRPGDFDLLLWDCPGNPHASLEIARETRALVGRTVPMGVTVDDEMLSAALILYCRPGDDATTTSPECERFHGFVAQLMRWHRFPVARPRRQADQGVNRDRRRSQVCCPG
jgi:hypothetical protein